MITGDTTTGKLTEMDIGLGMRHTGERPDLMRQEGGTIMLEDPNLVDMVAEGTLVDTMAAMAAMAAVVMTTTEIESK